MRLLVGSPSISSRQRLLNLARAASSIGNSRPGSRRTSGTGGRLRWVSGAKLRFGQGVEAALVVGVEAADRVDLVVEQVPPVRHARAHREQVDQPAAHCVLAGADHLRYMAVAGQRELGLELGRIELLPERKVKGIAGQKRRRRQP